MSQGKGTHIGAVMRHPPSPVAARRSPVVTLYLSESGLHPKGGLETGIIWPAHVVEAVVELDVVVATPEDVAVAPMVRKRVAADVV